MASDSEDDSTTHLEEDEEEAFVNFDDPEVQVLPEVPATGAPSDEDEADAKSQSEVGDFPKEKEPVRDDALIVVCCQRPLHCVAIHPTLGYVATGGEDDTITLTQVDLDAIKQKFKGEVEDEDAPAQEMKHQATVVEPLKTIMDHSDTITHLSFSPAGTLLASGGMDCTVRLYEIPTWTCTHVLKDLSGEITSLLWHPSGLALCVGAADGQAILYNAQKGSPLQYFVSHRASVTCMVWAMDVKKICTGSEDGSVCLYNPKTGEAEVHIAKDLAPDNVGITALVELSSDLLCVGCVDGSLHLISLQKGKTVAHLPSETHSQAIERIVVNQQLQLLISGGCDCVIAVWHTGSGGCTLRAKYSCPEGIVGIVLNGPNILAYCTDGDVRVWDARSGSGSEPIASCCGHRRTINDAALFPNKQAICTASDDGTMRIFSTNFCM